MLTDITSIKWGTSIINTCTRLWKVL